MFKTCYPLEIEVHVVERNFNARNLSFGCTNPYSFFIYREPFEMFFLDVWVCLRLVTLWRLRLCLWKAIFKRKESLLECTNPYSFIYFLITHYENETTKLTFTTHDGGCLGSSIDEERSKLRYVVRIAEPVNHRIFERKWRSRAILRACLFECPQKCNICSFPN